jgi:hypothetical protein
LGDNKISPRLAHGASLPFFRSRLSCVIIRPSSFDENSPPSKRRLDVLAGAPHPHLQQLQCNVGSVRFTRKPVTLSTFEKRHEKQASTATSGRRQRTTLTPRYCPTRNGLKYIHLDFSDHVSTQPEPCFLSCWSTRGSLACAIRRANSASSVHVKVSRKAAFLLSSKISPNGADQRRKRHSHPSPATQSMWSTRRPGLFSSEDTTSREGRHKLKQPIANSLRPYEP